MPMFIKWVARGAPTNMEQIGENVIVSIARLREFNKPEYSLTSSELAAAQKRFQEEFEVDAKSLRLPALKTSYAESLETEANKADVPPSLKYVLLKETAILRLGLGNIKQFSTIVTDIDNTFGGVEGAIGEAIPTAASQIKDPTAKRELIDVLSRWAKAARIEHRYRFAIQMLTVAHGLASSLEDENAVLALDSVRQEISSIAEAENKVKAELEAYQDGRLDAEGKSKLGAFYGFQCGDWELALPLLAEGADEELKKHALLELNDSKTVKERLELAQFWDKQSQSAVIPAKHHLALRSRKWYLSVRPELRSQQYKEVVDAIDALSLPSATLKVQLNLGGAGRLIIRPNEYRWEGYFGDLNGSIRLNSVDWNASEQEVLERSSSDGLLPLTSKLEYPKLKRTKGRGQVTLNQTSEGAVIVDLNDVPDGSDQYEFEIEVVQ